MSLSLHAPALFIISHGVAVGWSIPYNWMSTDEAMGLWGLPAIQIYRVQLSMASSQLDPQHPGKYHLDVHPLVAVVIIPMVSSGRAEA